MFNLEKVDLESYATLKKKDPNKMRSLKNLAYFD